MDYDELKEIMLSFHLEEISKLELTAAIALYQLKEFGGVQG